MRSRELENTDLPQRREGRGGTRRDFELLVSSVQFSEERVDLPRRREGAKRTSTQGFMGEAKRGVTEDAEEDGEEEKKDWRSEI